MPEPIEVVLADDHALFRTGLRTLLERETFIRVVGEASTGDEAVDLARTRKPDVLVMDISMPGSGGLEATRRVAALDLETRVLVLTAHAEEDYLVPVVQAGASGYLTKTSAGPDLVEAIRVVARGQVYLPPEATTLLLEEYRHAEADEDADGLRRLSAREQEVLALTVEGYSSREIGKKLFISPKTVDTYRSRLMRKLEMEHRAELVRFALRVGLLRKT